MATSWPTIRETCHHRLGITFDDWQEGAGRLILAKRADGKLATTIGGVGMSVCRQVGKTYLVGGMAFGLAVTRPNMLMIWSAHHARTHGETFLSMQGFARRSRIAPYVEAVYKGSGDEEIRFRNGSRILFGARERGFGRGIPGVDVIVSDEAQIMSEKALDAQLATMNTSDFGLALYIGTPPRPEDPSEAFTRMRAEAWAGTLEDAAWIEIGAEPGTDPNDRRQWPKWNPSYPKRTPVESILRLQRKLSAESFLREGMGMWDEHGAVVLPGWDSCASKNLDDDDLAASKITGPVQVAIDMTWDRKACSLVVAGTTDDGLTQVELVDEDRPGIGWLVARAVEVAQRHDAPGIILDPASAAGSLASDISRAGVDAIELTGRELAQACGAFYDAITERRLVHLGQHRLDAAVEGAVQKSAGDAWRWDRKHGTDISPLMAATLAAWKAGLENGFNIW